MFNHACQEHLGQEHCVPADFLVQHEILSREIILKKTCYVLIPHVRSAIKQAL